MAVKLCMIIIFALTTAVVASETAASGDCTYSVGGREWDLSPLRARSFSGPDLSYGPNHGLLRASLCGALAFPCVDALTHQPLNGSVFKYFGHARGARPASSRGEWMCWDVLGKLPEQGGRAVTASALPITDTHTVGLVLTFSHSGDAHLACGNVTVEISARCNASAAAPVLVGVQDGCTWRVNLTTAERAVCEPTQHLVKSTLGDVNSLAAATAPSPPCLASLRASGVAAITAADSPAAFNRSTTGNQVDYNGTRRVTPSFVVLPESAEEVQLCLRCATAAGVMVAVRSGGHSQGGYGAMIPASDGFVMSLEQMRNVSAVAFQPGSNGTVYLQGGARWMDVYKSFKASGQNWVATGGLCPTVGVAAFVQGGGTGPAVRMHGLGADSVISFRIATGECIFCVYRYISCESC